MSPAADTPGPVDLALELCGLGTAVPGPPRRQAQVLEWLATHVPGRERHVRQARVLFRRAGVRTRHLILDLDGDPLFARQPDNGLPGLAARMARFHADAPPLGARACRLALDEAGVTPGEIAHLVSVSCTGAGAPGLDLALVDALGLRPTTLRTHVGFMGCHGAFNGLAVLAGLARLHPGEPLLLCATELCSLHAGANADGGAQVADALFGDGAAAVVARHAPALPAAGALVPRPELAARPWRLLDCACSLLPGGRHDLTWNLGERGFVMGLTAGLPERLARHLPDWLGAWLDRNGLSVEAVPSWALHPGGPRILDAVCAALGLPAAAAAASREVLAEFGNMSSPTVLFVLQRLARAGAPRPCVALGFGPGPVAEAALFG